jgi:hypothetical protein
MSSIKGLIEVYCVEMMCMCVCTRVKWSRASLGSHYTVYCPLQENFNFYRDAYVHEPCTLEVSFARHSHDVYCKFASLQAVQKRSAAAAPHLLSCKLGLASLAVPHTSLSLYEYAYKKTSQHNPRSTSCVVLACTTRQVQVH